MQPLKLKLSNYMSYQGEHEVDFSSIQLAVLSGQNGAGKSSLIQAIRFALFGASRAGLDSIVTEGEERGGVELTFSLNGDTFLVSRSRSKKGNGKTTTSFQKITPEGPIVLDGKSETETTKKIESVLSLTDDLLLATAYSDQQDADRFSRAKPAERKTVLMEILQLDTWERRAQAARTILSGIENKVDSLTPQLETLTAQASTVDELLAQMKQCNDTADNLDTIIHSLAQDLDALATEREELVTARESDKASRKELTDLTERLKTLTDELAPLQERVTKLQALVDAKPQAEAGVKTAKESVKQAEEMETAREELALNTRTLGVGLVEVSTARLEWERQKGEKAATIRQLQDAEKARVSEIRGQINLLAQKRDAAQRDHETKLARLHSDIKHETDVRQAALSAKRDIINSLEQQAGVLSDVPCADNDSLYSACPLLAQAREADSRLPALRTELSELQDAPIAPELHKQLDAEREVNPETKYQSQIEILDATLTAPDPLPWADDEAAFRELDSNDPGLPLLTELESVKAAVDGTTYDPAAHAQAKKQAETLATWESRLEKSANAEKDIVAEKNLLIMKESFIEQSRNRIEVLNATLGTPRDFEAELKAISNKQTEVSDESTKAHAALEATHREHGQLVAKHEAATKAAEQVKEITEELTGLKRRIVLLELLGNPRSGAFSKGGIPALLIEEAIPQLQAAANEILGDLSDQQMSLEIRTQREVGKGLSETMDLIIFQQGIERDYATYSGGEKMRIDLSLRVGLAEFLASRSGAKVGLLVLDEPAAPLDERGRQAFCEYMATVSKRFDCCLVISHCPDIIEAFPTQLRVSKNGEGSRVEVIQS